MFFHTFLYRLKCMVRDREMMFWTLIFPLILGTFFNLAFSNLTQGEIFGTIPLAVIDNEAFEQDERLQEIMKAVSQTDDPDSKPFFEYSKVSEERALELLRTRQIAGYIDFEGDIEITVRGSGIPQTITKEFFDEYLQRTAVAETIISQSDNPGEIAAGLSAFLMEEADYLTHDEEGLFFPDLTVIFFYSLIGMACFYGAFTGIKEVNAIQADFSPEAVRLNVAPIKKLRTFISSVAAASLIQLASIMILLFYLAVVIGVDFGNNLLPVLAVCIVGCVCGVAYGAMIASLIRAKEGIITAIVIGTTMFFSFLAGMMRPEVKYAVTDAFWPVAYLNPVNVITDALYSLYYFETYTRYFVNMAVIVAFTLLFAVVTVIRLRRLKYASI